MTSSAVPGPSGNVRVTRSWSMTMFPMTTKLCVKVRLFEAHEESFAQSRRSLRQQLCGMLEHLRVSGINRNQRIDVAIIIGIKLPLHDGFRGDHLFGRLCGLPSPFDGFAAHVIGEPH